MSSKKLSITLFPAWNTYAISMMSVLEACGMWPQEATFQKFMGVTGIAAQFRMDKNCSALPITDYDWMKENTHFMERIGIKTEKYCATPNNFGYTHVQEQAIAALKKSIDRGRAAVVWGVDTGEFGIVDGYDDVDGVFFARGIGSVNANTSMPILYQNLGKTFDPAPILYCELPHSSATIDWNQAYINSLRVYVAEMSKKNDNPEMACGISAYDMIVDAIGNEQLDDFGLRYCIGIYYERKEAMFLYLQEIQNIFPNTSFQQIINAFETTVSLYHKLMANVMHQGMDGWNFLRTPIGKDCYSDMIEIIQKIKESEYLSLIKIKQFLQLHNV